jgi:hypothetical protein
MDDGRISHSAARLLSYSTLCVFVHLNNLLPPLSVSQYKKDDPPAPAVSISSLLTHTHIFAPSHHGSSGPHA